MIDRRRFSMQLAGAAGAASLASFGLAPSSAQAQAVPVAGKDYAAIEPPAPLTVPKGTVDVVEFFWYGCPHCYELEPLIEPWRAKLPADVRFRLVPYDFGEALRELHKRIYCTWEVLGLVEKMHAPTFARFHRDHKPINSEKDMLAFAAESGLDVAKVKAAWNSFGLTVKMRQAKQACDQFNIQSTPVLAVQGRYHTGPSKVGSGERAIAVTDWLINQVRKAG
jgi:thiol:disulfide interchange protein DsbA